MRALRGTLTGLLMILGTGIAAAQGCGPTRLKAVETVEVAASPDRVWAMIGDFHDLRWNLRVALVGGDGGNEPERATRAVTLRSGTTLAESLYRYDAANRSYAYHLDKVDLAVLPIQNASATLEVVPSEESKSSIVRWKMAFYRNLEAGEGAPDAADARAVAAVTRFLRAGLAGLPTKTSPPS